MVDVAVLSGQMRRTDSSVWSNGAREPAGSSGDARERKFRERLRAWLELVRLYWPESTARITSDGRFLELENSAALAPRRSS